MEPARGAPRQREMPLELVQPHEARVRHAVCVLPVFCRASGKAHETRLSCGALNGGPGGISRVLNVPCVYVMRRQWTQASASR